MCLVKCIMLYIIHILVLIHSHRVHLINPLDVASTRSSLPSRFLPLRIIIRLAQKCVEEDRISPASRVNPIPTIRVRSQLFVLRVCLYGTQSRRWGDKCFHYFQRPIGWQESIVPPELDFESKSTSSSSSSSENMDDEEQDDLFRCAICGVAEGDSSNLTSKGLLQTNTNIRCGHQL